MAILEDSFFPLVNRCRMAFKTPAGLSGPKKQANLTARRQHDADVQNEIDASWRAGGKNRAAALVLSQWGPALTRRATKMVGKASAEDVIGITIFSVLERHNGGKYANLRAALTNAVKFAAIDHIRKQHDEIELVDDGSSDAVRFPVSSETPEQACLTEEESNRLMAAVVRLDKDRQRLVHARYFADPPAQVEALARSVGKSKRWVEKELAIIKRQLRVLLVMDDLDA